MLNRTKNKIDYAITRNVLGANVRNAKRQRLFYMSAFLPNCKEGLVSHSTSSSKLHLVHLQSSFPPSYCFRITTLSIPLQNTRLGYIKNIFLSFYLGKSTYNICSISLRYPMRGLRRLLASLTSIYLKDILKEISDF